MVQEGILGVLQAEGGWGEILETEICAHMEEI
jgi:hypothetical protein